MVKSPYKKVLLVIEVSDTDYCWDGHISCPHFDNPGGHGQCDLDIGFLKRDKEGIYPKPKKCLKLIDKRLFDTFLKPVDVFK